MAMLTKEIYADAEEKYKSIAKAGSAMLEEAFGVLFKGSAPLSGPAPSKNAGLIAINTVPDMLRREVITIDVAAQPKLKSHAVQVSSDSKTAFVLAESDAGAVGNVRGLLSDAPPVTGGCGQRQQSPLISTTVTEVAGAYTVANSTVSMTIKDGRIVSLKDVLLE